MRMVFLTAATGGKTAKFAVIRCSLEWVRRMRALYRACDAVETGIYRIEVFCETTDFVASFKQVDQESVEDLEDGKVLLLDGDCDGYEEVRTELGTATLDVHGLRFAGFEGEDRVETSLVSWAELGVGL